MCEISEVMEQKLLKAVSDCILEQARLSVQQLNAKCRVLVENLEIEHYGEASENEENQDSSLSSFNSCGAENKSNDYVASSSRTRQRPVPISSSTLIESGESDINEQVGNISRKRERLFSTSESGDDSDVYNDDLEISVSSDETSDSDESKKPAKGNVKRKKTLNTKRPATNNSRLRQLVRRNRFSLVALRLSQAVINTALDGNATKACELAKEDELNNKPVFNVKQKRSNVPFVLSSEDEAFGDDNNNMFTNDLIDVDNSEDSDIEMDFLKAEKRKKQKKVDSDANKSPRKRVKRICSSSSEDSSEDSSESDSESLDSEVYDVDDLSSDLDMICVDEENKSDHDGSDKPIKRKMTVREGMDKSSKTKKRLLGSQKKFNTLFPSLNSSKKPKKGQKKARTVNGKSELNSTSSSEEECEIIGEFDKTTTEDPTSSRKKIRRILTEKELREATRKAQHDERQRLQRIADKTSLAEMSEKFEGRLILEFDKEKNPLVEVDPIIVQKLKKHQFEGIKFLWNCLIESVEALKTSEGSGCILAHSMGLGKTLQVIAFIHTLLSNEHTNSVIRTCAVVCPKNTSRNWANEFKLWLTFKNVKRVRVFEMDDCKNMVERVQTLQSWHKLGGVLIVGMPMFTKLIIGGKNISERNMGTLHRYLVEPGADVIICDEGHKLKNSKSQLNEACNMVKTKRRAILTGTPLQNCLQEYHVMMNFVKPDLLGSEKEFTNRFVNPISNGQHLDSTSHDVKVMKKRVHVLHKLLDGCVQRYDYRELVPYLQPKFEYTIYIQLTELQIKLYQHYLDNFTQRSKNQLFKDHQVFMCIWNHPATLYSLKTLKKPEQPKNQNPLVCDSDSDVDNEKVRNGDVGEPSTSAQPTEKTGEKEPDQSEWFKDFVSPDDKTKVELSGKMVMLFSIIDECERLGEKLVIFSQSCLFLDLLEQCLQNSTPKRSKGSDYLRIDGKVDSDSRKKYIDKFNSSSAQHRLFLVATRSGSLGINLYGANRCVIFDACWNPTHDSQAVCRLYRLGQKKTVFVYRLIAQGTMEEKIYEKQIIKESLSCRVIDEQQIERHFTQREIAEMYKFFPDTNKERPTPVLPKDDLLADLLKNHRQEIVTYREHDSLLANKPEEDLTEEERKSAWDEWEQEKDDELQKQKEAELREQILKQQQEQLKQQQEQLKQQQQQQQQQSANATNQEQHVPPKQSFPFIPPRATPQQTFSQQQQSANVTNQEQHVPPKQSFPFIPPRATPQQTFSQQQQSANVTRKEQQAPPKQSFQFIPPRATPQQHFNEKTQSTSFTQPPHAHQASQPQPRFHLNFQAGPRFQAQFKTTARKSTTPQTESKGRRQANTPQANQPAASNQSTTNGKQPSVGLPAYDSLIIEDVMRYLNIVSLSRDPINRFNELKEVGNILTRGISTVKNSMLVNKFNKLELQKNQRELTNLQRQLNRLKELVSRPGVVNNLGNGIIIEEADEIQERAPPRKSAAVLIEELD